MVTLSNFLNGVLDDEVTPIPAGLITVVYPNQSSIVLTYDDSIAVENADDVHEHNVSPLEFRNMLGSTAKQQLDHLKDNIDDDVEFLATCTNLQQADIDTYRDVVRMLLYDFYTASDINVHHPDLVSGLNLLVSLGVITQVEANNVILSK